MKNLFKLLCCLLLTLEASCQTLPLTTSRFDAPNGAYLKDMDIVLPFWTGTWTGISDNKEYTFQFTTFPHHHVVLSNGDYFYEDILKGKFKVVDLITNQVLYNDMMVTNFEDYKIELTGYGNNIGYRFCFRDDEVHCDNFIEFTLLKNASNPNQITYTEFGYISYFYFDCQYSTQQNIPMFLPKVTLTLTRQL
ncbi:hypothetical protein [Flavobacterium soli]|uniref:hypothetical protein n=1 Tax=Flavobacterium soli TaxID=344881 RepID=UPI0003F8B532|nr:hypothetical protein [Flavobacterium soli]